ncbi:MAG: hypothetical protein WBG42_16260 [Cryomorphaceae bacterium]
MNQNNLIQQLIKKVQEKLEAYKLSLAAVSVEKEYTKIENTWNSIAKTTSHPVKYLIIGEATVSYKNYFYNSSSKQTPFLTPKHFNCKRKVELINLFQKEGVLIFDLYPLPLPTFIYDNVSFDCMDDEYVGLLNEYYQEKLEGLIDKNTTVVLRYIKLEDRSECDIFKKFLIEYGITVHEVSEKLKSGEIITRALNISGSTYANPSKIKSVFSSVKEG